MDKVYVHPLSEGIRKQTEDPLRKGMYDRQITQYADFRTELLKADLDRPGFFGAN